MIFPRWGKAKTVLVFLGMLCKALAFADPLPWSWGSDAKAVAGALWAAIDGTLVYLLQPPAPKEQDSRPETGAEEQT